MVQNFPGPFELRFSFTALAATDPLSHTQRLNLDLTSDPAPGTAFLDIDVVTRGGVATPDLETVVEAWLTLIAPRFETLTTFGIVELWKYSPLSFESTFISSRNPSKATGDDASATVKANQEIYTLRTVEGGIYRMNLMETVEPSVIVLAFTTGIAEVDAIFNFITSSVNWILARDTSYPFSSLNYLPGQNEKSFRQRFR